MYSLEGHGKMLADPVRINAYTEALRQSIRPGMVVLDIGAGTGFFSVVCCRLGARKVYAVESAKTIELAKEIAAANGCRDRIEFIHGASTEVNLPEPADLIVADLRGVLPMFGTSLKDMIDARNRLLAPGGKMVPASDSLWAAIVEAPETYRWFTLPWNRAPGNVDVTPALKYVLNDWRKVSALPDQLLCTPKSWGVLNYSLLDTPSVHGNTSWTVERTGTAHGLLAWFDAQLVPGISFSNAPQTEERLYGQAFFPMATPAVLEKGDRATAEIHADAVGNDYLWRWSIRAVSARDPAKIKIDLQQSTLFSFPIPEEVLRRREVSYRPVLSPEGRVHRRILEMFDGETAQNAIAERLVLEFPGRFTSERDALEVVVSAGEKFSRWSNP